MDEQQLERENLKPRRGLLPKNRRLVILVGLSALFLLTGFVLGQGVGANSGLIPGSEQDPLVTASWVEARLSAFAQGQPLPAQPVKPAEPVRIVEPAPAYTVVVVEAGKKLLTGEGSEFILRSGNARAVVPIKDTGLVNLTTGKNLNDGETIQRDHLYLSPRDDGRGVVAETQAIFLVRSKYRII